MDRAVAFNKKRDELVKPDRTTSPDKADELEILVAAYEEKDMQGRPSKLKRGFSAIRKTFRKIRKSNSLGYTEILSRHENDSKAEQDRKAEERRITMLNAYYHVLGAQEVLINGEEQGIRNVIETLGNLISSKPENRPLNEQIQDWSAELEHIIGSIEAVDKKAQIVELIRKMSAELCEMI
ncbi:hypothetical protein GLAREA_06166 [Glarea lozoyensis ATCC 20868]|uniref:Uncharacterized protein n=1 Tax=Glarea lozoyensis (strain ATCC 20868 / MF5171) TaxID=1116229 RepID=S3D7Q7_GLAL2|nr:uncharacterized protein GLAREA_06166 [Glarea lozoyensis ATCC 20868]EPE33154.1 hypothetical protein GLAREA_06166 [Glarea lozoyensis ATCC 20868]